MKKTTRRWTQGQQTAARWFASRLDRRLRPPIFIIAPPRSGSTFLFEGLRRARGILSHRQEGDRIWWQIFPYPSTAPSDFVAAAQATPTNIRRLREGLLTAALRASLREHTPRWHTLLSLTSTPHRYRLLDKTIANCFHLKFLERAYPAARYIFLVRDPRPNISSMMEGWTRQNMMGKPQLSSYIPPDATISHWSYPAPPGWQAQTKRPLVEICAWSWQQHIEYALRFVKQHEKDVLWLRYEDLVAHPEVSFRHLSTQLNLPFSAAILEYATRQPHSRTTISAPEAEKWRHLHGSEIEAILPLIRDTAYQIGYAL